jgi:hypothetical protein
MGFFLVRELYAVGIGVGMKTKIMAVLELLRVSKISRIAIIVQWSVWCGIEPAVTTSIAEAFMGW